MIIFFGTVLAFFIEIFKLISSLKVQTEIEGAFLHICSHLGMMCAMFVIVFMRVQIEQRAVLFGTIGSIPGLIFGFKFVRFRYSD